MFLVLAATGCLDEGDAPAPVIERITPDALCTQGAVNISIFGENFAPDSRVRFIDSGGDAMLPRASIGNETSLVTVFNLGQPVNGNPPEAYDVEVESPDGQVATLPAALTSYPELWFTTVSPTHAPAGAPVRITLTGGGFYDQITVELGVQAVRSAYVENLTSATSASFELDLTGVAPGSYPLSVRNRAGCELARDFAFTVE